MSHFSVLVIGENIEDQLQPYHEYECTGKDDQYVVDVDTTDEIIEQFNKPQKVIRLADGTVFCRYDDRFYTERTKENQWKQEFILPAGAVELEMTAEEARSYGVGYKDMDDCAERWNGAKRHADGLYYKRTNPNAKWDWWVMGGRWTGFFLLKPHKKGVVRVTNRTRSLWDPEPAPAGYCDQALKGDIDFEQMRNDKEIKARLLWQETRRITNGESWESWADVRVRFGYSEDFDIGKWDRDASIKFYNNQPAIKALKASGKKEYSWDIDDDLALDLNVYQHRERDRAVTTYAFVRDSAWTQKGEMGWWGMSNDEVSQAQWNSRFNAMLDTLPDDTLLTIVDCHI